MNRLLCVCISLDTLTEHEDNDENLDDLWEENIPLKLQERLENIGSSGNEAEPKMEFDRTTVAVAGRGGVLILPSGKLDRE